MTDLIILALVTVIVVFAMSYIIKAKKNGAKCIGCSACSGCSSCANKCKNSCPDAK